MMHNDYAVYKYEGLTVNDSEWKELTIAVSYGKNFNMIKPKLFAKIITGVAIACLLIKLQWFYNNGENEM